MGTLRRNEKLYEDLFFLWVTMVMWVRSLFLARFWSSPVGYRPTRSFCSWLWNVKIWGALSLRVYTPARSVWNHQAMSVYIKRNFVWSGFSYFGGDSFPFCTLPRDLESCSITSFSDLRPLAIKAFSYTFRDGSLAGFCHSQPRWGPSSNFQLDTRYQCYADSPFPFSRPQSDLWTTCIIVVVKRSEQQLVVTSALFGEKPSGPTRRIAWTSSRLICVSYFHLYFEISIQATSRTLTVLLNALYAFDTSLFAIRESAQTSSIISLYQWDLCRYNAWHRLTPYLHSRGLACLVLLVVRIPAFHLLFLLRTSFDFTLTRNTSGIQTYPAYQEVRTISNMPITLDAYSRFTDNF